MEIKLALELASRWWMACRIEYSGNRSDTMYIHSGEVHLNRVIDDQIGRTKRVYYIGITTQSFKCISHSCKTKLVAISQ